MDDDVHNLFTLTLAVKELLFDKFDITPITTSTFEFLKNTTFDCKVLKALRFVYLCSLSLFGSCTTMMVGNIVRKSTFVAKLKELVNNEHQKRII